jgi:hypothetical protein
MVMQTYLNAMFVHTLPVLLKFCSPTLNLLAHCSMHALSLTTLVYSIKWITTDQTPLQEYFLDEVILKY